MKELISDEDLVAIVSDLKSNNSTKKTRKIAAVDQMGDGSLYIEIRKSGASISYRYFDESQEHKFYIGRHHLNRGSKSGYGVNEAMTIAKSMAIRIREEGLDAFIIEQDDRKYRRELERKRLKEEKKAIKYAKTFEQLLCNYRDSYNNPSTHKGIKNILNQHLLKEEKAPEDRKFDYLLRRKARDIKTSDLEDILKDVFFYYDKEVTRSYDSFQEKLKGAFRFGIDFDDNISKSEFKKVYFLKENPAEKIKRPDQTIFSEPDRCLTDQEIWLLWHHSMEIMGKSGYLIRLLLAIGGIRPKQLANTMWVDVQFDNIDYPNALVNAESEAGTQDQKKKRSSRIPFNDLALKEMKNMHETTGHCEYILAKTVGRGSNQRFSLTGHLTLETNRQNKEMAAFMAKKMGLDKPRRYTIKFLRKTITSRFYESGVDRLIAMRIQGHTTKDDGELINSVHDTIYNTYDFMSEKHEALMIWQEYIQNIINKPLEDVEDRLHENGQNITNLPRTSKRTYADKSAEQSK